MNAHLTWLRYRCPSAKGGLAVDGTNLVIDCFENICSMVRNSEEETLREYRPRNVGTGSRSCSHHLSPQFFGEFKRQHFVALVLR